jgi:hypothetical protein
LITFRARALDNHQDAITKIAMRGTHPPAQLRQRFARPLRDNDRPAGSGGA